MEVKTQLRYFSRVPISTNEKMDHVEDAKESLYSRVGKL